MSGVLGWSSGLLINRGTYGYFWSSTPGAYTYSRLLYFYSTNVNPKDSSSKPNGLPLRRVARFTCVFLPELSAASLFRLCCQGISTGTVVFPAIEVSTAISGHRRLTPTHFHGSCTSPPLTLTLRMSAISRMAYSSAASPKVHPRHTQSDFTFRLS